MHDTFLMCGDSKDVEKCYRLGDVRMVFTLQFPYKMRNLIKGVNLCGNPLIVVGSKLVAPTNY